MDFHDADFAVHVVFTLSNIQEILCKLSVNTTGT